MNKSRLSFYDVFPGLPRTFIEQVKMTLAQDNKVRENLFWKNKQYKPIYLSFLLMDW